MSLGTTVIKIWLHRIAEKYPDNNDWFEPFSSLTEAAKSEYVRELFDRQFSTYILLTHSRTWSEWVQFQDGMIDNDMGTVRGRFEELTSHLLSTCDGTGKKFVLQHWKEIT